MTTTQTSAADKLAQLLEDKEQELQKLRDEIEESRDSVLWKWTRHKEISETQTLPVPRLEIWLDEEESDDYNKTWVYRMIHRHFLGHCVAIPLGETKQGGGNKRTGQPLLYFLPLRDGSHIRHDAKAFGWPAFMVSGDEVVPIPLEGKL